MSSFTTLLLDVDGTLLNFAASAKAALKELFHERKYVWSDHIFERYTKINLGMWERYEKGLMPRSKVLTERFDVLFQELVIAEKGETFEEDFRIGLTKNPVLMEGAIDLLDYLFPKYKLYVVTNGVADTQRQRMASTGLDKYMQDVFISELIGSQKPQKEFFDYCLEHIAACEKDQIMLIGDSLTADILGGNNSGLTTCWYNPDNEENPGSAAPDFIVHTLAEIKQIL